MTRDELFERARYNSRAAIELDDLLRAEREAERRPYVRRFGHAAGLVHKTTETERATAPKPAPPSDGLDALRREMVNTITASYERTDNKLRERDKRIAALEGELREMKGKLDAALAIISGSTAIAAENSLKNFLRRVRNG